MKPIYRISGAWPRTRYGVKIWAMECRCLRAEEDRAAGRAIHACWRPREPRGESPPALRMRRRIGQKWVCSASGVTLIDTEGGLKCTEKVEILMAGGWWGQ